MTFRFQRMQRRVLALACLCLAPLSGHAADPGAVRATVDRAIAPIMAQYGVPGVAVGVTVDGNTMFFSYGVASKEGARPVTEHTLFELGSVSKPFTAILGGYARALGNLALDDHPSRFIAPLQGTALDKATLLDLGTYSAGGLPLQVPDEVTNDEQMLAWLRRWTPEAPPGTARRYSNPSIGLFGRAAALALRTDFSNAMERQLFPALGLRETHIRVPAEAMPGYAWGHDKDNKPVRVSSDVFDAEAYGVKSSASDMIRFLQVNIEPARLAQPFRAAVEGTQVGYFKVGEMVQGLGWEQYAPPSSLERLLAGNSPGMSGETHALSRFGSPQPAPRGALFNKTGATRGFGAYTMFIPEERIGIVILANKAYPIPERLRAAWAILEQLRQQRSGK